MSHTEVFQPPDLMSTPDTPGLTPLFPQAKVVDDNGQTVPVGATGELLIRGYCVMLGYWDDEAKNRETITPSRWYKTG